MATDDSTAEGGWPPPGLENALRIEQRGGTFVLVNDKGEKVFYAVTRRDTEEARAYLWTCMRAGVQPNWYDRHMIDPANGKPLPTIDEKLAAIEERFATIETHSQVSRRGGEATRHIVWRIETRPVIDDALTADQNLNVSALIRKLRGMNLTEPPDTDQAFRDFIEERRLKLFSK
jgi:hypothetical protein